MQESAGFLYETFLFSKKVFSLVFEILKKSYASHQYMKLKIHIPVWFLCSDLSC